LAEVWRPEEGGAVDVAKMLVAIVAAGEAVNLTI